MNNLRMEIVADPGTEIDKETMLRDFVVSSSQLKAVEQEPSFQRWSVRVFVEWMMKLANERIYFGDVLDTRVHLSFQAVHLRAII